MTRSLGWGWPLVRRFTDYIRISVLLVGAVLLPVALPATAGRGPHDQNTVSLTLAGTFCVQIKLGCCSILRIISALAQRT
jgi:hypothetical protein